MTNLQGCNLQSLDLCLVACLLTVPSLTDPRIRGRGGRGGELRVWLGSRSRLSSYECAREQCSAPSFQGTNTSPVFPADFDSGFSQCVVTCLLTVPSSPDPRITGRGGVGGSTLLGRRSRGAGEVMQPPPKKPQPGLHFEWQRLDEQCCLRAKAWDPSNRRPKAPTAPGGKNPRLVFRFPMLSGGPRGKD